MLSGLNKLNSLFQKLQAKIMVRIVTVLLFFVSYYSSAKIIWIEPSSNIFSYVGRFDLTSLKKVKFAHSGNQIEFQFKGNSFHIGFSNIYFEGIENKNFFSVIINGKVKQVIEGTSYLKYHKVEVNSPDSFSNVEIFKRTEALSAIAVFHGVEYTQGEFRAKASKKRPKVCLKPMEIKITQHAEAKTIKAKLLGIKFFTTLCTLKIFLNH